MTSRSFAEDVLTGTSPDCVLRGQATTILNEVANHADHRELQKLAENNKKEKTMKAKFSPSDIEKPSKAIDIFGKQFSEESKAKGVKFGKDNNYLV